MMYLLGSIITLIVLSLAAGVFLNFYSTEDYCYGGLIILVCALFWFVALPAFVAWIIFYGLVKLGQKFSGG